MDEQYEAAKPCCCGPASERRANAHVEEAEQESIPAGDALDLTLGKAPRSPCCPS